MARENQKLDQLFKNKLEQHSEKPSELAWERLENKLSKKSNSNKPLIWWSAAASVSILFVIGFFLLQSENSIEDQPLLTEKNPTEQLEDPRSEDQLEKTEEESTSQDLQEEPTEGKAEERNQISPQTEKAPKQNSNPAQAPKELIASAEEKNEAQEMAEVKSIKTPDLNPKAETLKLPEIPELDLNKAVAELDEEQPAYTLKIYSDGIEEEKDDKNIITGIGKKVDQVEGLLGKVDQGFADLQDAKNNIFASLTTKKERNAQKP